MMNQKQLILSAIDSMTNPFAAATPEQEKLVLDAAEKWAQRNEHFGDDQSQCGCKSCKHYEKENLRGALNHAIRKGRQDKLNARVEWAMDDTDTLPYPNRQEDEYIVDAVLEVFEGFI